MLQGIEFGRPDEASRVRARAAAHRIRARCRWCAANGASPMRGWKAPSSRSGSTAPAASPGRSPTLGFDPEGVSIERLNIEDGRAVLADAASGSRLVLDKLEFKGEVRSLAGPVKGEGSFVVAGQHYPYRIATSRIADDGGIKVRLDGRSDRPAADRRSRRLDLDRARHAALRRQPAIRAPGRPRAGGRAGAHPRAVARHQPDQGRQHGGGARADRVPVRPGRAGDQAQGQRQSDVRPAAASSTARCRRRRSISTACWRCPRRRAAARSPRSRRSPNPCSRRRGCRSRRR